MRAIVFGFLLFSYSAVGLAFEINGNVYWDLQPYAGVGVTLSSEDGLTLKRACTGFGNGGGYKFINVLPGKYTLQFWKAYSIAGGNYFRPVNVPVQVMNSDIELSTVYMAEAEPESSPQSTDDWCVGGPYEPYGIGNKDFCFLLKPLVLWFEFDLKCTEHRKLEILG